MKPQHYHYVVQSSSERNLVDFLAPRTGLSKTRIKDAMQKGAVWLRRNNAAQKRVRRATSSIVAGDVIDFYYDEQLLQTTYPQASRLWDNRDYSIWYKPAGLLAQGTRYGDHACLLRQIEHLHKQDNTVFLVHRLDREADGLMLIAHNRAAARRLSDLFAQQQVEKHYRVTVQGRVPDPDGEITLPLDDKPARTRYRVLLYDDNTDQSRLLVQIDTGRTHQIRRHFDLIGHPVIGDPRYGHGNKNVGGMQLTACYLHFICPFQHKPRRFDLDQLRASAEVASG